MKIEEALKESQKVLSLKRYEHVERVVETSFRLAHRFGADSKLVGLAAALHDYAKDMDPAILKQWIIDDPELPKDLLMHHIELWHGPVAAKMSRKSFLIENTDILNAIRYHTTGRKNMSKVEKIVFLADYIEPGRDFPAVYEARSLAETNLDRACQFALKQTIQFLSSKNQTIYPDTLFAYNDLSNQLSFTITGGKNE